ncbi:MAG: DUF1015 domain-containing protein [Spirochaetaceae bacterium]|nr:MAG: DUF1015 domain-containing protein [Spirochaetaceae bacterium]
MTHATEDVLARLGVAVPEILLPAAAVDPTKWAVIACDQHTSEPDYWHRVAGIVADAPSTLRMIFPEVYLNDGDADSRIERIQQTMHDYLSTGVFRAPLQSMVLTHRSTPHVARRRGLLVALDLDRYDYRPGARALIRASEATIVDRLPPRVRVRSGAPLELPHVLVLIDDPDDSLFCGLDHASLPELYSAELMLDGGTVSGYQLGPDEQAHVARSLDALHSGGARETSFLFAVGDGNHSLATAKQVWEQTKRSLTGDTSGHPGRYALVELVNVYDPGLRFEPIHRHVRSAISDLDAWIAALAQAMDATVRECGADQMMEDIHDNPTTIGFVARNRQGVFVLHNEQQLAVTALQEALDQIDGIDVDYIHGSETATALGRDQGVALLLPAFDERLLFTTVANDGVLPRKAFSLGEAEEKRYYFEARRVF